MLTDSTGIDSVSVFTVTAEPAFIYASRIRNPFSVSTMNQKQIDYLTEPTIEPLLNSIPGLWMQTGALNTNRISIRGTGYKEPFATTGIKIYLDEIPLTNGAGESSIEDIHPFILSGIDIWRGPASALWGSGLGGMIHLKTRIPISDSWNSRIQMGSYDRLQVDQNLSIRYGKDDQMATLFHYQYLHDGGYRDNNNYRKQSGSWLQQWRVHESFSISTFFHGIDLKAFIPSSINENDYTNNPHVAAPGWGTVHANEDYQKYIGGINLKYSGSDHWVYSAALFGTYFDSDEVRPFNVLNENNSTYGMRHRVTWNLKQRGHLNLGVEYFREHYAFSTFETLAGGAAGDQLSEGEENRTYFNGFFQSEFDLDEKWILFAGLHLTGNKIRSDDLISDFPVGFYPTAGLNYLLEHNISLSGSISRGYSNLSLDDILNSDGMIAEGIQPETGWSEEVSFLLGEPSASFVRLGVYNMNIENTIVTLMLDENTFEKINAGSSLHQGVELEYQSFFIQDKLVLKGSYTFQNNKSEDLAAIQKITGYPDHKMFNRIAYSPSANLEFQLTHIFRSEVSLPIQTIAGLEGYQLFHIGTTYNLKIGEKWKASFSGTVQNLFDVKYSSMFQPGAAQVPSGPRFFYPGKPRSFYLTFDLVYNL